MTVARILRPAADQAVCHGRRLTVSGCSTGLIKEKQERHVVGEDDDLARLAGLGQPDRHPVAMQMVERGDGIIEHDRGLRVDGRQLGKKSGERDASMLAFAQDLADRFARLVDQSDLEEGDASGCLSLLKFDSEAGDAELVYLDREPPAQAVGDQRLGDTGALSGDLVRRGVLAGFLDRLDDLEAINLGQHIGFHHAEPFAIGKAIALGDKRGALRGVGFRLEAFDARGDAAERRAQGIERDGARRRKIRQDRKAVGSQDSAQPPRRLENLAAKGVRGFLLADIIADHRNDRHEILHGDGVRRDLLELFGICGRRLLFAALALVLHESLETAEPLGGFLAEQLLTQDAMGANLGYRERAVGIGGGARIIPGRLPQGLPDV